jgi:putative membrane protein
MMIGMVLFWGAILLGIAWFVWGGARSGRASDEAPPPIKESPLEILERRFAEGAISVGDYRERRQVLVDRTGEPNGVHKKEALTAPQGEGSRS